MRDRSEAPARAAGKRVNPMASVVVITAAALVGVGVLAVQANGSAPKVANKTTQEHPQPVVTANPSAGGTVQPPPPNPLALPANSGSGERIVYSLSGNLIWLVGADNTVQRTAHVVAGTVHPTPGDYKVSTRTNAAKGQDGTPVQYIVIFGHSADGTSLGFDAVYNIPKSTMPTPPTGKTGGVRMTQDDAQAVWQFTSTGTAVKVVP